MLVNLTFHSVSAFLLAEFAEKIVKLYYLGNMNAAVQNLIVKVLDEQKLVLSHMTNAHNSSKA